MIKLQATEAVRAVMRSRRAIVAALAVGAYLFGLAPMMDHASAQSKSSIARDNDKRAEREAKRAERAAAREAKKKEREAKRAHKSDDDALAKAKPSKAGGKGERNDVDLGDDDPLEGL